MPETPDAPTVEEAKAALATLHAHGIGTSDLVQRFCQRRRTLDLQKPEVRKKLVSLSKYYQVKRS